MRKLAIFVLVVLVLSLGSMTLAQDHPPIQCGSLSAADCTLLTDSGTAMQTLKSATFDLNLQLAAKNIPDSPDMAVGLTGKGAYAADLMALSDSLSQVTDPQAVVNAVALAIKGFNSDLDLNLTLPPEAMSALGSGAGPINIQLRLVDGIGYINFDPLDAIAGGQLSQSGMKGWVGLDLSGAVTQLYPMMQSMMPDLSGMTGTTSGSSDSTASMNELMSLPSLTRFFTVTRQADANGAAVFVTNLDIAALVNDPQFQQEALALAMAKDPTVTEDQFKKDLSTFSAPGTTFTITVTQAIDLSTNYLRSEELALAANMDLSQAAGSTMSTSGLSQLNFDASITFDNFNSAPAITAPEGATVIPLAALFSGMSGG